MQGIQFEENSFGGVKEDSFNVATKKTSILSKIISTVGIKDRTTANFIILGISIILIILFVNFLIKTIDITQRKSRNAQRLASVNQIEKGLAIGVTGESNKLPYSSGQWKCVGKPACWGNELTSDAGVDAVLSRGLLTKTGIDPLFTSKEFGDTVIYNSNWGGGIGKSGIIFPSGAYLQWLMEDQSGAINETCGRGGWWANTDLSTSKPSYQCFLRIGNEIIN